jgi:hypothetical protein
MFDLAFAWRRVCGIGVFVQLYTEAGGVALGGKQPAQGW